MNRNRQIAIILTDTLQQLGLYSLLSDYFPQFATRRFSSFLQFAKDTDSFDFYFTDADTYASNLDYFLLRRSKTFILIHEAKPSLTNTSSLLLPSQGNMDTLIEILQPVLTSDSQVSTPTFEGSKELSAREINVLQEIVRGSTNKEIADHLNISLNTVLSHRKNITAKLGIKTVSGLTFYAIMNGIVSGEEIDS